MEGATEKLGRCSEYQVLQGFAWGCFSRCFSTHYHLGERFQRIQYLALAQFKFALLGRLFVKLGQFAGLLQML